MKHRIVPIILVFVLVCMPLTALADAFTPADYMMYYPDSYSYITGFATALNIGGGALSSVNWSECNVTKSNEPPMTYKNKGGDFTIVFDANSEKEEANYAQLAVTNQRTSGIYAFPFVATFMTYGHHLNMEDFMQALGWVASFEVEKPGKAGSVYETSSYYMAGVQPGDGHSLVITVINKKSELSENYVELKKGSKGDAVKALQEKLNAAGYSVGSADGDFGGKTATSISNFQKDMLLPQTGALDLATYTLLNSGSASTSTPAEPVQSATEFDDTGSVENDGTGNDNRLIDSYDPELFSETGSIESVIIKNITSPEGPASALLHDGSSDSVSAVAVFLHIEMMNQNVELDSDYFTFSSYDPVYVCKHSEDLVSAAFKFQAINRYVLVYFQREPLAVGYGVLRENDMGKIKEVLEANNESVWEISAGDYKSAMYTIAHQLGYI